MHQQKGALIAEKRYERTMNEAIEFVMNFYNISKEDAVNLYWDEIEAYMSLQLKLKGVE
jgi:hypothetical protein